MSFLSVGPQSRVVLESHSDSLLAQFDTHLQIIADRYLAFFQERRSIEATYIDSLWRLYHKANTVDAPFDPRIEPTTTITAWGNIIENLAREARTQQAFVDILDNDVIQPLRTLKVLNDQTRKRIEEDLKKSAAQYADHAENVIPKLQQAYLKKYHPQQYAHSTDVPNKTFGGKVSALLRSRRGDLQEPEAVRSGEVSDDDWRRAVSTLHDFRLMRAENLRDGYDRLEEFVFTPTIKDVLVKYMEGMTTTSAKYNELAMSTRAESEMALAGTDTSDIRGSFRRALSLSIPLPALYRNYRPGVYSDLIFGVPLVDLETNQNNIPKVIRMCIEAVEQLDLNTKGIYLAGSINALDVLQLRRRFESDKSFSFGPSDHIQSIARLLKLYLSDLPEPLFVFSLQDYRTYRENRAKYAENDFSLLRLKIGELHPVHRASLGALLQHLLHVASHSAKNSMTVKALATQFSYPLLRGNAVVQGGVDAKCLLLEDLIRNAHTLFDERPSPTPPVPSPDVAETTSTYTYSSFTSPELPQPAEIQATGSTSQHGPGLMPLWRVTSHHHRSPCKGPYWDFRRHRLLRKEWRRLLKSRSCPSREAPRR
ncbi:Rho GTPase activation protein [Lactarius psammicola]|nr:Rho GTPase activation protein [Lactarius psammicola]